jgi:Tfp pilus assembly protein PilX
MMEALPMVKKVLACKKGASSVLVILMLLVLVVFGIAALTTALSGLRLGQKVSAWSESYYHAEGEAAYCWAEIDAAVSKAAEKNGASFRQSLADELAELDFDTELSDDGSSITYEVRDGSVGLHVTLALDMKKSPRLHATEWYQMQP